MKKIIAVFLFSFSSLSYAKANAQDSVTKEIKPGILYTVETMQQSKKYHVVEIDIGRPEYKVRATAPSEAVQTVSQFAKNRNAIVTINGDFFHRTFKTVGLAVGNGKRWEGSKDTVKTLFIACTEQNECVLDTGSEAIAHDPKYTNVVGGLHYLIKDGVPRGEAEDKKCGYFCTTEHPRTAIGLSEDKKKLIMVVVEGRNENSGGLRLQHVAEILKKFGAHDAINLDGGGSSSLVIEGRRVSARPADEPEERPVANHLSIISRN